MTNIYQNPMPAIAANHNPISQRWWVNLCKSIIYSNLSKTKTKSTRLKTLLLAVLLALLAPLAAKAQFGGGTGVYNDPYIISTTDHMKELADSVNIGKGYWDKHFYLTNDLDFSGIEYTPIGGVYHNGILTAFSGTFDGGYHSIKNVQINKLTNTGLFSYIVSGSVKHLTLGGNSLIVGHTSVGGIAGGGFECNILDCHVEKTVTIVATVATDPTAPSNANIGGIVGAVSDYGSTVGYCQITNCTSAATITINGVGNMDFVGGIAGYASSTNLIISYCRNYGAVAGNSYVGGVVGHFNFNKPGSQLKNCYTGGYCTLYGVGQDGSSQGINLEGKAVSMHTISSADNVAMTIYTLATDEFEGKEYYKAGMQVSLRINSVTGTPAGHVPLVEVNGEQKRPGDDIEITMPAENVHVAVSQYLRDIAYTPWVSISLSPESLEYNGSVQLPDVTVTDIKDGTPVVLIEGTDYEVVPKPYTIYPGNHWIDINGLGQYGGTARVWFSITAPTDNWIGEGTEGSPYLIFTTDDMHRLATKVNSSSANSCEGQYFSLQNDLDYTGKDYLPIGTDGGQSFKGTFNGNGHSISNVVIQTTSSYLGLFAHIGAGGSVNGLTLGEGSSIEGDSYVAGIAAWCKGTVSDCSTAEGVTIKANQYSTGGIVCKLYATGRIANCQNHADVSSSGIGCGGIVGTSEGGEVSSCINFGRVEGTRNIGGIIGGQSNKGTVEGCVNEGSVSGQYRVGGVVGNISNSSLSGCLNLGEVSASDNDRVGSIAGNTSTTKYTNNYYAGASTLGGIGADGSATGADARGAQRGYTVGGENGITIGLEGTTGLAYKGIVYAGHTESITINIYAPAGYVPINGYSASAGTLTPSGNTWTLAMPEEDVVVSAELGLAFTVPGYGESTDAGWRFIASPAEGSIEAANVGNIFGATQYDLYRFDQSEELEWRNHKAAPFELQNGMGYLYATKDDVTLIFGGTYNTAETQDVPLVYDASASFAGWNLVGNPFPVEAYANRSYYTMNAEGTWLEPNLVSSATAIPACTGVMVLADGEGQSVTFSRTAPQSAPSQGNIQIAVAQANTRGNAVEDKAIVSFNEGDQLGKFVFNEDNAKLYIPQGGKDYAIAVIGRDAMLCVSTETPVNFKATKNGTYTLTVNVDGMDLDYLHLIDNMTSADVDLLSPAGSPFAKGVGGFNEPATYTFTAKTTDYASRFKLVFNVNDASTSSVSDAPFAYISNGEIIVNGEGTLQVIDMLGHVVRAVGLSHRGRRTITGIPAGVYVLRLIDGDSVRTQKIVIQ